MAARTLSALIELYLARCRVEGKSPATLRAYRETLGRFQRVLAADGAPQTIDGLGPEHVIRYLDRFAHLAPETRHRYFREVRCFLRWCQDAGFCEADPFRGLRNVRLPVRVVTPFRPAEVQALVDACVPATPGGRRDRALLLLLLDTGLRCSELVALDHADLDLSVRRVLVRHGKGGRQRVVPVADRCAAALAAYLADRGEAPGPLVWAITPHGTLRPGVRLQPNGLKQLLRRLGRRTGLPRVHAHRFRHTFATWAIAHQARELDVQHLLGHAGPEMVRRYTATYDAAQAARRHAAFSPADQMTRQ